MDTSQECSTSARMLSSDIDARQPLSWMIIETAEYKELIPKWSKGLQDRRQLECGALSSRSPAVHDCPIRKVNERHARRGIDRARFTGESWNHPFKQRQRDGCSHAAQERPAR